jgi:hypothetical protein
VAVLGQAALTGQHFRGHVGRRPDNGPAPEFGTDDPANAVRVPVRHAGNRNSKRSRRESLAFTGRKKPENRGSILHLIYAPKKAFKIRAVILVRNSRNMHNIQPAPNSSDSASHRIHGHGLRDSTGTFAKAES